MKKSYLLISCMMLFCIISQSCELKEEELQSQVEDLVKSRHNHVLCSYSDGIVTLVGMVESQDHKWDIERTLRKMKYVKGVSNRITVDELAAIKAANHDVSIHTYVHSRLSKLGCEHIDVKVNNREVKLSGNLKKEDFIKIMHVAKNSNAKKVLADLTITEN